MVKNLASIARGRDITGGFKSDSRNNRLHGVCIGEHSTSTSTDNVAVGAYAVCNDEYSVAVGSHTTCDSFSVAIGPYSNCEGAEAVAVGYSSNVRSSKQTVIGWSSGGTDSDEQVVIGRWCTGANNAPNQTILGSRVAGGQNAPNQIVLGSNLIAEDNVVGTYISPIREDNTLTGNNYVVTYNTDTKELKHTVTNLDTSGNALQGLQSVTDIGNTTTNNIEVSNSADPNDKIEYGHDIIKIHGNDNSVLIGDTETANGNTRRIAIGHDAGKVGQASSTVAIGPEAGIKDQGYAAIAIGDTAGGRDGMGERSIAIGFETGTTIGVQPLKSICIGSHAQTQENAIYSIAIGDGVDVGTGAYDSIALGKTVTLDSTASRSIGIGDNSEVNAALGISIGRNNTISVGHDLCIAIGTGITTQHPSSFYVSPVRDDDLDTSAKLLIREGNFGEIKQYKSIDDLTTDIINNNVITETISRVSVNETDIQDIYNITADVYNRVNTNETNIVNNTNSIDSILAGTALTKKNVYRVESGDTLALDSQHLHGCVIFAMHSLSAGTISLQLPALNDVQVGMHFTVTVLTDSGVTNSEVHLTNPTSSNHNVYVYGNSTTLPATIHDTAVTPAHPTVINVYCVENDGFQCTWIIG